ncbi:MAG: ferrochelatase [Bacteroidales bacterium]|nr:ferrochelatase [Bacteroidales bacterium]
MIGILLVNMGSPSSQKEMRKFLFNMFSDFAILPLPEFSRKTVAFLISITRYKKSWQKYEKIGGSPMKISSNNIEIKLQGELGNEFPVFTCSSYLSPRIKEGFEYFKNYGINKIKIIPLYPHSCFSTTGSVKTEIKNIKIFYENTTFEIADEFYKNKYFIFFWKFLIEETINKNNLNNPILLFSAHSITEYQVTRGDTYISAIEESSRLIAESTGLEYKVSYQSKMGKLKWVEPETKSVLREMAGKNQENIVVVPLSFISENLETLYDLDIDIIPYAKNELKIKNICRVKIPNSHPLLIQALKDITIN